MGSLDFSKLYDEITFYRQFADDLKNCKKEVIVESPFISINRMKNLIGLFQSLVDRNIKTFIVTRDPRKHSPKEQDQAEAGIRLFEKMGVQVFVTTNYSHRKLAIIDRKILWEGSLNILSQTQSREIMRRINSSRYAVECFEFLKLGRFIC